MDLISRYPTIYFCASEKQAQEIAKILPRVFMGPKEGESWKLQVWAKEIRLDAHGWEEVAAKTAEQMHGWVRGYLYAMKRK